MNDEDAASDLFETPSMLYRAFGEHDDLLYVGFTCNLVRRLETHRHDTWWWPTVRRLTVEPYYTYAAG